jgi:hypothetical protein
MDKEDLVLEKINDLKLLFEERFEKLAQRLELTIAPIQKLVDTHLAHHIPFEKLVDDRLNTLEIQPGKSATSFLKWIGSVVGGIMVVGIFTLIGLGIYHQVEQIKVDSSNTTQIGEP